jgi:hypothetical protein
MPYAVWFLLITLVFVQSCMGSRSTRTLREASAALDTVTAALRRCQDAKTAHLEPDRRARR